MTARTTGPLLVTALVLAALCSSGLGAPTRAAGAPELPHALHPAGRAHRALLAQASASQGRGEPCPNIQMNILGDTSAKVQAYAGIIADPSLPVPSAAKFLLTQTQDNAFMAGDVIAAAAASNRARLAEVLGAAAAGAAAGGRAALGAFEGSAAAAFSNAYARGSLGDTALAFAESVVIAGNAGPGERATLVQAYGAAIAKAATTCGPELVAEASAQVYCSGTAAQAQAWSEAVAEAVTRDRATGCLVLTRAVSRARARCAGGAAQAEGESSVTRQFVGECAARGDPAAEGALEVCPEMAPPSNLQEKWWGIAAETFTTFDDVLKSAASAVEAAQKPGGPAGLAEVLAIAAAEDKQGMLVKVLSNMLYLAAKRGGAPRAGVESALALSLAAARRRGTLGRLSLKLAEAAGAAGGPFAASVAGGGMARAAATPAGRDGVSYSLAFVACHGNAEQAQLWLVDAFARSLGSSPAGACMVFKDALNSASAVDKTCALRLRFKAGAESYFVRPLPAEGATRAVVVDIDGGKAAGRFLGSCFNL